ETNGDQAGTASSAGQPAGGVSATVTSAGADDDTSILTVNAETGVEAASRTDIVKRIDQDAPISKTLIDYGFDEQSAKSVEASFADTFQVQSFAKTDAVAVRGLLAKPDDSKFTLTQISLYRDGKYVGTLALSDKGTYESGADPWFGQDVLAQTAPAQGTGAKLRLLDSIYAAAVRNGLPTSIAGEIILLLSRAYDLDQSATDGDRITILYSTAARDPRTGFGRVLYVGIERSSG